MSVQHVYVAADTRGRHKIGVTGNPRLRAYHLSRDLGVPVQIVHLEPPSAEAENVETFAHWELASSHDGGEWFLVDRDAAVAAVEAGKEQVRNGEVVPAKIVVLERYGFPAHLELSLRAALAPGETRAQFMREAVESELRRRAQPA